MLARRKIVTIIIQQWPFELLYVNTVAVSRLNVLGIFFILYANVYIHISLAVEGKLTSWSLLVPIVHSLTQCYSWYCLDLDL